MGPEELEREQDLESQETPAEEASAEGAEPTAVREPVAAEEDASPEPETEATDADSDEQPERESGRAERGAAAAEGRRRQFRRRRVCAFCVDGVSEIDYKDPMKFRRYISDRARIEPRRKTGTCAKHQRWLSVALKRARHLALLPYTPEHIRVTGVFAPRK